MRVPELFSHIQTVHADVIVAWDMRKNEFTIAKNRWGDPGTVEISDDEMKAFNDTFQKLVKAKYFTETMYEL